MSIPVHHHNHPITPRSDASHKQQKHKRHLALTNDEMILLVAQALGDDSDRARYALAAVAAPDIIISRTSYHNLDDLDTATTVTLSTHQQQETEYNNNYYYYNYDDDDDDDYNFSTLWRKYHPLD